MHGNRRHPAHVYLPPAIAEAARARADQLGLRLSTYFAVLLRNYVDAGTPARVALPEEQRSAQVRERIPFSVQPDLWRAADAAARRLGGTVSLLLEALVVAEITSPSPDLIVRTRGTKPNLR